MTILPNNCLLLHDSESSTDRSATIKKPSKTVFKIVSFAADFRKLQQSNNLSVKFQHPELNLLKEKQGNSQAAYSPLSRASPVLLVGQCIDIYFCSKCCTCCQSLKYNDFSHRVAVNWQLGSWSL